MLFCQDYWHPRYGSAPRAERGEARQGGQVAAELFAVGEVERLERVEAFQLPR